MIEFWSTFWTVTFLLCLLLFAAVAVYVSVGAIGDIRALFQQINCRENKGGSSSKHR